MNCPVGFVNWFFLSSPSLPRHHGTRQQGWYINGTLRKHFPNLTRLTSLYSSFCLSVEWKALRRRQASCSCSDSKIPNAFTVNGPLCSSKYNAELKEDLRLRQYSAKLCYAKQAHPVLHSAVSPRIIESIQEGNLFTDCKTRTPHQRAELNAFNWTNCPLGSWYLPSLLSLLYNIGQPTVVCQ